MWPPGGEGSHNKGAAVAGGVGGSSPPTSQQAAPQGLVHWMSVMAEHMNNPHHDAVHYMWNGMEVSVPLLFSLHSMLTPSRLNTEWDDIVVYSTCLHTSIIHIHLNAEITLMCRPDHYIIIHDGCCLYCLFVQRVTFTFYFIISFDY